VQSSAVPFRGLRVGTRLRARAETSRGVGLAVAGGVVCPFAVVAAPGIGFPGAAAGSGRELCFTLSAQRAAVPRLRRSHTCRCGPCRRGRNGSARVGRSLSVAAGRPASSPGVSKMPLRRYQRAASGPGGVVLRRFPPSAREMPLSPAPSAPAVPPGFDGLLRCAPRRVRAPGVPLQLALKQLPSAFLLQPTLGFMPFRRLPPCPPARDPSWCLSAPGPQES